MNKLNLGLKALEIAKGVIGKKGAKEAVKANYGISPIYVLVGFGVFYAYAPEKAQLFLDGIKAAFGVIPL